MMRDTFGLCRPALVTLRGPFANRQVFAWRYQDWAAHRSVDMPDRWLLTLLPIGLCLPPDCCCFLTARDAIAAMIEIARLRNDWAMIRQADLTKELGTRLKRIARRHGAVDGPIAFVADCDAPSFGYPAATRLNGYVLPAGLSA